MITQEFRNTAWQDVTDALKESRRGNWVMTQELVDALEVMRKVYQEDLDNRYGNDPGFCGDNYEFLTYEIDLINAVLRSEVALPDFFQMHAAGVNFIS